MALFLSALSLACFVGAAVSLLRFDSKHFDLLVLSGVIFLPSFEADMTPEDLKSIDHRLRDIEMLAPADVARAGAAGDVGSA